jgi:hypothetical protein
VGATTRNLDEAAEFIAFNSQLYVVVLWSTKQLEG